MRGPARKKGVAAPSAQWPAAPPRQLLPIPQTEQLAKQDSSKGDFPQASQRSAVPGALPSSPWTVGTRCLAAQREGQRDVTTALTITNVPSNRSRVWGNMALTSLMADSSVECPEPSGLCCSGCASFLRWVIEHGVTCWRPKRFRACVGCWNGVRRAIMSSI